MDREPNTASGYGRLSLAKLAYIPVFGDLKSGMPELVLTPAPVWDTVSSTPWIASVRGLACHNNNFSCSALLDIRCYGLQRSGVERLRWCSLIDKS